MNFITDKNPKLGFILESNSTENERDIIFKSVENMKSPLIAYFRILEIYEAPVHFRGKVLWLQNYNVEVIAGKLCLGYSGKEVVGVRNPANNVSFTNEAYKLYLSGQTISLPGEFFGTFTDNSMNISRLAIWENVVYRISSDIEL